MEKKKVGIITSSSDSGKFYKKTLEGILSKEVDFCTFSFDAFDFNYEKNINVLNKMDLLLISTQAQYEIIKKYYNDITNIIVINLTLSKAGFNKLKNSSLENKDVLLVNMSLEMCIETISLLYTLGFDNINFVPVYPNMDNILKLEYGATTGEMKYMPDFIKEPLELGNRMIDESTILELLSKLKLDNRISNPKIKDYLDSVVLRNSSLEYLFTSSFNLKNQLDLLLNFMEKGVIILNKNYKLVSVNKYGEKILERDESDLVGKSIFDICSGIDKNSFEEEQLVKIKNEYISFSTKVLEDKNKEFMGAIIVIEDFKKKEDSQNKLRLQLANKGHYAKHTIKEIIGSSSEINRARQLILKFSKTDYPVLITGESGTGKELVAQAIHNLSKNKDKHFVAINCAALNPTLLESELFGYEAGAFTGALKSGKMGIFELANNGTLFLDEIGEIPIEFQTKLLRAIQEKEIMRVGGSEVIKINLRLITATNVDLVEKIRGGKFRSDLYYRLNVLPINLPPLRSRSEDIKDLIEYFVRVNSYKFSLSSEAKERLEKHRWSGNIRELINCLQYLDALEKSVVSLEDLPYHILECKIDENNNQKLLCDLTFDEKLILKTLYDAFTKKEKIGRRTISQKLYNEKYNISENQVKVIINRLEEKGLVTTKIGRAGSCITKEGVYLIERMG